MSVEALKIEVISIAKLYRCKVRFIHNVKKPSGFAETEKSMIVLNMFWLEENKRKILSAAFHEIGHVHCYKNNIWSSYHKIPEYFTRNDIKKYIATSYKAESWVDKWAEKEMKKHCPRFKYYPGYPVGNKERAKWLRNYQQSWIDKCYVVLDK